MESVATVRNLIKVSTNRPPEQIFRAVLDRIETNITKTVYGMHEAKAQTTKERGDKWEAFCYLYLKAVLPSDAKIYFLKEIPSDLKKQLNLPKPDLGIDLVVIMSGAAVAVQCKYRNCTGKASKFRPDGKTYVTYKELSTFLTLCARTGPWSQHIVMTNCDGASWRKLKTTKDITINNAVFAKIPLDVWKHMGQGETLPLPDVPTTQAKPPLPTSSTRLSPEELRAYRAKFYEKKT